MSEKDNGFDFKDEVSLKEFIMHKIQDMDIRVDLHFKMNKIALDKAEEKMDIRLNSMNEFRDALRDQTARFIDRTEYTQVKEQCAKFVMKGEIESQFAKYDEQIRQLELSKALLEGKASRSSVNFAMAVSVTGIIIAIISAIIRLH
jgi:hypothetical protein